MAQKRRRRERLDKVIARAGVGSRKDVRELIKQGRVQVDGVVAVDYGEQVDAERALIEVDGERIIAGALTVMLNKPLGVVTATTDSRHPTVLSLLPAPWARRLFPAGRLDKETEGLLILTDDGELCHRLISPRRGVEKQYRVSVDGAISASLKGVFAQGVRLADGYVTRPSRLHIVKAGPPGEALLTVTEGKYHQVRRMFAACGLHVTALRRERIGSLVLDDDLPPGAYRRLQPQEIERLLDVSPL